MAEPMEIKIKDSSRGAGRWCKPSVAAKHFGVSLKVFRSWIKHHGLPYSRLPSNRILISLDDVDLWLRRFQKTNKQTDHLLKDFT
jgi:hypothetical protein